MATLERDDEVFVLNLGDGENRFHPDLLASVGELLDQVEAAPGPKALVTAATGKFWSNGLDLEWLGTHGDELTGYVGTIQDLLARMLTLPVPTAAALQGHTFAGGLMLALAHDVRIMRADRGFACLPEVDIQIPFTPGMSALIQARLTKQTAHEAMTTGRRYGGTDAMAAGMVDGVAEDEAGVLAQALERVRPLTAKAGPTLGTIKQRMYGPAIDALRDRSTLTLG